MLEWTPHSVESVSSFIVRFGWCVKFKHLYRASHVLADWVLLTLIWDVPPSCPVAQPLLPNSHQPKQNWADSGTVKIQVNPTQIRQEMSHPVFTKQLHVVFRTSQSMPAESISFCRSSSISSDSEMSMANSPSLLTAATSAFCSSKYLKDGFMESG